MPQDHHAFEIARDKEMSSKCCLLEGALRRTRLKECAETVPRSNSINTPRHMKSKIQTLRHREPIATMAACVACHKALVLYLDPEEEDGEEDEEDEAMEGSASANPGSYVDDDVQLQCGCHFHWSVHHVSSLTLEKIFPVLMINLQTGNVS